MRSRTFKRLSADEDRHFGRDLPQVLRLCGIGVQAALHGRLEAGIDEIVRIAVGKGEEEVESRQIRRELRERYIGQGDAPYLGVI